MGCRLRELFSDVADRHRPFPFALTLVYSGAVRNLHRQHDWPVRFISCISVTLNGNVLREGLMPQCEETLPQPQFERFSGLRVLDATAQWSTMVLTAAQAFPR